MNPMSQYTFPTAGFTLDQNRTVCLCNLFSHFPELLNRTAHAQEWIQRCALPLGLFNNAILAITAVLKTSSITSSSTLGLTGFGRRFSAPVLTASTARSIVPWPVKTMIGTAGSESLNF